MAKSCYPDPTLGSFVPQLKATMARLETEYVENGTVDWITFSPEFGTASPYNAAADEAGRAANQKKVITLTNADFALGTLRITQPCKLLLTEDILFNPNAAPPLAGPTRIDPNRVLDWRPDLAPFTNVPSNAQYFIGDYANGYRLGFFAALAIEAEGVILDLNGYSIAYHPEFALMQRFGSIVELSDQPFRPAQGPTQFGTDFRAGNKIWIKNGLMGNAHHNIHGNGNADVLITDMKFKSAEIAAISINSPKRVHVEECEDKGGINTIPVIGTFSAARFAVQFGDLIDATLGAGTVDAVTFQGAPKNALAAVKTAINEVFNDVIYDNAGAIDSSAATGDPTLAVYQNLMTDGAGARVPGTGLISGTAYSMLFHPEGVSILDFLPTLKGVAMEAVDISVQKCAMNNIFGKVIEVPAAVRADGSVRQLDPTAAVVQFLNTFTDDDGGIHRMRATDGAYVGTSLSDLQIAIAAVQIADAGANPSIFGFTTIDPATVDWATDNNNAHLVLELSASGENQLRFTDGPNVGTIFAVDYSGDSMHHVIKGMVALRLDGVNNFIVKDVTITNIISEGVPSLGVYINASDGGNPAMTHRGYFGGAARGVRASSCQNGLLENVRVRGLESFFSQCIGIEVAGESAKISVVEPVVSELDAGTQMTATTPAELKEFAGLPNVAPIARGIVVHASTSDVCLAGECVKDVTSYSGLQVEECPVEVCQDC